MAFLRNRAWDKTPWQGQNAPPFLPSRSLRTREPAAPKTPTTEPDFGWTPHEEILVYPLLKQRVKMPRVRVRVRLNEQEKALGVLQRMA